MIMIQYFLREFFPINSEFVNISRIFEFVVYWVLFGTLPVAFAASFDRILSFISERDKISLQNTTFYCI